MKANQDTPLAMRIQDKLDNQGFLNSDDLRPFLSKAIADGIDGNYKGIVIDGFPRCTEQLDSFDAWALQDEPLLTNREGRELVEAAPHIVLLLDVTKSAAKARYLARARHGGDDEAKFERRFAEYLAETGPVEEAYRRRGIAIKAGVASVGFKGAGMADVQ
jgi:UMP-CMP kinase